MPWFSLAWSGVMTEDDEPCRGPGGAGSSQDGRINLAGARDKLAQIDRRSAPAGLVTIGRPAFASAMPHTDEQQGTRDQPIRKSCQVQRNRNLAIGIFKLTGHPSIAAACRHHARDATRTLDTLGIGPP